MILPPIMHASSSLEVVEFLNKVVLCHTDMVETVHTLKAQVAAVDAQNRHLTNKVTSLESKVTSLESKVASMDKMNDAPTIRVALLEHIAEEQRSAQLVMNNEKDAQQQLADEKRAMKKIADEQFAEQQRVKF